jgi:hypothetical protein
MENSLVSPFKPILPHKNLHSICMSGLYSPSYQTHADTSEPQKQRSKECYYCPISRRRRKKGDTHKGWGMKILENIPQQAYV